jgi:dTDP-L-rhamnose 4-epimerase
MKPLCLISGGAGFIGSHTCDLLLKKGYSVRILDNLSPKTHNGKWPEYLDPRIEKIKGDVRKKSDWKKALNGVSYVIHLAAWMDLMPEFSKFTSINITGTANLYEVALSNGLPIKKIVVASSQFVYGQGKWNCKKDGVVYPEDRIESDLQSGVWDPGCPICSGKITSLPNTEDHNNPPNAYAISKYAQELMAINFGKLHNIPSTALRYSIVHGARQSFKNVYSGALRIFTLQLASGQTPTLFEDGNQIRDYVSVLDVAAANVLAMESSKANYEAFNVGGGKAYSVTELAKLISSQIGPAPEIKANGSYRAGDIRHAFSDIEKIKKLGWEPKHSEEENVQQFIEWFKSQKMNSSLLTKTQSKMSKLGVLKSAKNLVRG